MEAEGAKNVSLAGEHGLFGFGSADIVRVERGPGLVPVGWTLSAGEAGLGVLKRFTEAIVGQHDVAGLFPVSESLGEERFVAHDSSFWMRSQAVGTTGISVFLAGGSLSMLSAMLPLPNVMMSPLAMKRRG